MKIFLIALLLVGSIVQAAGPYYWEVKEVRTYIQIYKLDLQAMDKISQANPTSEDEKTERDLALCEIVGASERQTSNLYMRISALMNKIPGQADRFLLDRIGEQVNQHNVALKGFCLRSYKGNYRDIGYLQSSLAIIQQDFAELEPILEKYQN
jgi:hypothetical protein